MTRQFLVSIGVLAAAAAVVVCSAGSAAAQGEYVVPRTEYGHPDLQGFWTNQTYTPLERPRDVDKAFYTEEEAAAIWQGRAGRESSLTTPGTIPDVHYDFTQFGLDRSQSTMTSNLRTSLIVDPPDGRLPPVTAEGRRRAAERRAARGGEGRPVRPGREPAAGRPLHHHRQRRAAHAERGATTPTSTSCRTATT